MALALTGTLLMGAIAVAEIGARPGASSADLLAKTIRRQRVAQGLPAQGAPAGSDSTPSEEADLATRQGILAEATRLEGQMNRSVTHIEQMRVVAYHDKNLIRMNFLTTKLDDMKQVLSLLTPAFAEIRQPGQDLFVMRAKLTMIRQGAERLREAAAAAENSLNDDSPDTLGDIGSSNAEASPSSSESDPTLPGAPTTPVEVTDRPGQASPYQ